MHADVVILETTGVTWEIGGLYVLIQEIETDGKHGIDQPRVLTRSSGPRCWIEGGEEYSIATMVFVPTSKQAIAVSGASCLFDNAMSGGNTGQEADLVLCRLRLGRSQVIGQNHRQVDHINLVETLLVPRPPSSYL